VFFVAVLTFVLVLVGPTGTVNNSPAIYPALLNAVIVVALGFGTYEFGKQSARAAAEDVIKPHARSAFRRIVSLGSALTHFLVSIESQRVMLQEESDPTKGLVRFTSV
jgi:hypothetical protein